MYREDCTAETSLRTSLLQVVRSSLVSALAVLLKRGWLEVEELQARVNHHRATFFRVSCGRSPEPSEFSWVAFSGWVSGLAC